MKKLHIFIIKSYTGPLVMTFFIAVFVLLMQFLWKYIDEIVGKGLEWYVIAELLLYTSPTLVPMALPLAILLSSIMTFGNLGENYELVALKSSGISLQRIMMPLIVVSVFISVLAFFFSNNVMPLANLKANALLYDVRNQRPQLTIKEGIFNNDIEGYSIKVGKKDNKKNMMYDILIYDHKTTMGNRRVTVAKSGTMILTKDKRYLILTLYDGYAYEEQIEREKKKYEKSLPHQREKFEEQKAMLEMIGFNFSRTDEGLFSNNCQMFSLKQLNYAIDSLNQAFHSSEKNLAENLLISTYFRKEQSLRNQPNAVSNVLRGIARANDTLQMKYMESLDTTKKYITGVINFDSLYAAMDYQKKIAMYDYSSNLARAARSYISNTKEELDFRIKNIRKHEIEWHRKFTLSFACFVLFFIGAPLGAIIRKGGLGMPVVVSVFFFIIYYVISISGEKFVREEMLSTFHGMWLSSVILMPLGIFLTYKAAHESVIMNTDTYFLFVKNIFKKKVKKNENTSDNQ
ncbi:MAG: LptF/LptG family permease [Bacteroidia bacterium]|nr:LptF/LptG family permease [Bacteroidia bacterium]